MNRATIFYAAFVLLVTGTLGQLTCNSVDDCPCGSVCVDNASSGQCKYPSQRCTCKEGCFVFNQFLVKSNSATKAHGNRCSCPNPVGSNSTPSCTRRMWHPYPTGVDLYVRNPNCYIQQGTK